MTIRFKITTGFIAVILIANSILSLVTVLHISNIQLREVQTRVRLDLNSARQVYNNHIQSVSHYLQAIALEQSLTSALQARDQSEMQSLLQTVRRVGGMDMLSLISPEGRVIYRAHNPEAAGDDLTSNPAVAKALREKQMVIGTVILPKERLLRDGEELIRQAHFDILDTPASEPTEKKIQSDGMIQAAVIPILGPENQLLGLLYGARLLNRWHELVNAIRDQVFQNQTYRGKEIGTATIFQGDLRIATNVLTKDKVPALGTRMSTRVAEPVLGKGQVFADRAFVVDDWYITAYEPIRDPDNQIIGALYVGLLEAPYTRMLRGIVSVFLPMMAVTTFASLILLFFMTRHILWPIDRIIAMSRKIIAGDISARTGIRPKGEMGLLCQAVDRMADAIEEREEQLKQTTRQQIGQSEKLASIGRLAAGVAHEINNPLTGVLTFSSLMRQKANMDEQDIQDLDLIVRETTRVREIVRGLLDFARESPSIKQPLNINEVIANTMRLVRSQKEFRNIRIEESLAEEIPPIRGDKNQLQQVLLNLSMNACEAMPGGGTLTLSTAMRDGKLVITLSDTGHGIKKEHKENIFEPFFTTKPVGKGTGLGLSVSYGIIQQHGGSIDFESEEGKGTTFTVILPPDSGEASDAH